jgi:sugar lactone lactonase YvrE
MRETSRQADRVTASVCFHGEGPFWDAANGRFLCMDVLRGEVIEFDLQGNHSRHPVPSPVATTIRRRASGGFVIAVERGVVLSDDHFRQFEHVADVTDDPSCRTNDGGCDPLGGFVIGTMAYGARPGAGGVYRVSPDREVVELLAPVTISNGVHWSADGRQVFYIDTPTGRIDTFDCDPQTGGWTGRRVHLDLTEGTEGSPDGMAIDDEGGLWVALWGGGAVNHYDPAGSLVETIRVPGVSQVSSCAFGGEQRNVLFITTSREGLADNDEPDAGAVFAVETRFRGAMLQEFAG